MASNILGKISKERTVSAVILVIAALASILPGGMILAVVLYAVSLVGFLELEADAVSERVRNQMRLRLRGLQPLPVIIL